MELPPRPSIVRRAHYRPYGQRSRAFTALLIAAILLLLIYWFGIPYTTFPHLLDFQNAMHFIKRE